MNKLDKVFNHKGWIEALLDETISIDDIIDAVVIQQYCLAELREAEIGTD